jgi:hypothetical protein
MALWPTQSLTEISTRDLPGGKKLPAHRDETSPSSVSRLSSKCVSLDGSKLYGLPRIVMCISLLFLHNSLSYLCKIYYYKSNVI